MLPFVCFSCNTVLADKVLVFESAFEKICNNPQISDSERENQKVKLINSEHLGIERYCCRTRMMSYIDLVKVVK